MMKNKTLNTNKQQNGAVLIVALVMLLILTILGVAIMESSVIEERMAGNYMDRNRAFQGAELALRDAEQWIQSRTAAPIPQTAAGSTVYVLGGPAPAAAKWWDSNNDAWWTGNAIAIDSDSDTSSPAIDPPQGLTALPRYVIEEYSAVCDTLVDPNSTDCILVYRITARAWSGRNTNVTLQSLYSRRF
jgi:type IV pilus assembly protein PilX